MNNNDRIDPDTNETLESGDVRSGIGLLNSHNTPQSNEWSKLNKMKTVVDNVDVNGDYFYMNSSNIYVIINHSFIDYTNRIE